MKLHNKIILMIGCMIAMVIGFISIVINLQLNASIESQMGNAAKDMAIVIANMPEVGEALAEGRKDDSIQQIIEHIRVKTRYQYVIVMDMEGIQYTYPYESGLYKPYKNGGESKVLESGKAYISADTNELISAIRAFEPVYMSNVQVGAVLVGLLTDEVQTENMSYRRSMEYALVIALIVGIIVAFYLARNIKKAIYGLEPKEIALLLSERDMIFQSIERGIIAMDQNGQVLIKNKKANMILNLIENENENDDQFTHSIIYKLMIQSAKEGEILMNEQIVLDNHTTVLLNLCLMHGSHNEVIGVVASLENLTQVRALAEELTDYRYLVDSLRAQNHEFMNKLQTISGLVQLEDYDEVLDFISDIAVNNKRLNHLLSEQIRDNRIAGLLLAKHAMFMENKIEFHIDSESFVDGLPPELGQEEACSIIGNLLENSMEAVKNQDIKIIEIWIQADENDFNLEVVNNGPEIDETMDGDIYKQGFSTKGNHRGYGLFLVKTIVDHSNGTIEFVNSKGVKWNVHIPRH